MKSEIFTVLHEDKTFQKYQVISDFSWSDVHYFSPGVRPKSLTELVRLYKVNIFPKILKTDDSFIFFNVPKGINLDFDREMECGYIYDDNILLKCVFEEAFQNGALTIENDKLISKDEIIANIINELSTRGMLSVCKNTGTNIVFVPVNKALGFISDVEANVSVNSHFFLMDPTDMASPYCQLGTPYGFSLERGKVLTPPLNHRALLLVDKREKAKITHIELKDLTFTLDEFEYIPGVNCELFFRPDNEKTAKHKGCDVIITENKVVAVKEGGESIIPVAGFVLSLNESIKLNDNSVIYKGLEDYLFGAQVGPEMVVDSVMKESMDFPFFREGVDTVLFAPTVYPLPYESARAARICLGTDKDDKPVIIWAEGAGKLGIDKKCDSTGSSLLEMAQFCASLLFKNVINLDGGGSAQIIYKHKRHLKIADRLPVSNKECERPVPNGIKLL